jgi:uncharacterized membrane protein YfcA
MVGGGGTLSALLSLFALPTKHAINVLLAHDLGTPGRTTDAVGDVALSCLAALPLPALFVAPAFARRSARGPVMLFRRQFALCLAAVAIRLLLHD